MNQNTYLISKNVNEHYEYPQINLKFNTFENDNIVNLTEYNELIKYKNYIDTLENTNLWDKAKKFSNCYELIYLPNKKIKYDSISKYEPLSRAYFKLFEILVDFKLINSNNNIKISTIAEGPGGFIEAIKNYRKRFVKQKDNIFAITLYSSNKDIPGWNKSKNFLKKNPNINVCYGIDGTGNLYNIKNILEYIKSFNHDADFITSDGGFDFSYNFNKQEQLSYRILFCEIVTALSIQKIGGAFVCKFFDIFTEISQSFIYLLYSVYDYVYITKPNTSRSANSEKYIVCKGFKGIDNTYLKKLYIIVDNLEYINNNNMFLHQLFKYNINDSFKFSLNNINSLFFNYQINSIKKTLDIIDNKDLNIEFNDTIKTQTIIAYKWCKYYKISVNYNSKYLIHYKQFVN